MARTPPPEPKKPKLKVYRFGAYGNYETMCAAVSAKEAGARMYCNPRALKAVPRAALEDPDSAAVRLALAFPETVWRRERRIGGYGMDYWKWTDGTPPVLPPVSLKVTVNGLSFFVELDYETVYGGDENDRRRHGDWLRALAVDNALKLGYLTYAVVVGPPATPEGNDGTQAEEADHDGRGQAG